MEQHAQLLQACEVAEQHGRQARQVVLREIAGVRGVR